MNNTKPFRRIDIYFEPDLLEALTQECRRLEIPRATLIKALCREFVKDSDLRLEELIKNKDFKRVDK